MTEPRLLFVEQARAVVGFVESAWDRLYPRWRASDGAEAMRQADIKDTLAAVREHSLTFLVAWGAVCGVPEAGVRKLVRRLEAEAIKARLGGSVGAMTTSATTIDGVSFLAWVAVGRHGCQWCAYLASTGLLRTATEPTAGEALAAAAAFLAGAGRGSRQRRRPAPCRSPLGGAP